MSPSTFKDVQSLQIYCNLGLYLRAPVLVTRTPTIFLGVFETHSLQDAEVVSAGVVVVDEALLLSNLAEDRAVVLLAWSLSVAIRNGCR